MHLFTIKRLYVGWPCNCAANREICGCVFGYNQSYVIINFDCILFHCVNMKHVSLQDYNYSNRGKPNTLVV